MVSGTRQRQILRASLMRRLDHLNQLIREGDVIVVQQQEVLATCVFFRLAMMANAYERLEVFRQTQEMRFQMRRRLMLELYDVVGLDADGHEASQ